MGLSYTIQYKKGTENCVVDALSGRSNEEATVNAISAAMPLWLEEVLSSYVNDDWATKRLTEISINPTEHPMFSVVEGIIKYKKKKKKDLYWIHMRIKETTDRAYAWFSYGGILRPAWNLFQDETMLILEGNEERSNCICEKL